MSSWPVREGEGTVRAMMRFEMVLEGCECWNTVPTFYQEGANTGKLMVEDKVQLEGRSRPHHDNSRIGACLARDYLRLLVSSPSQLFYSLTRKSASTLANTPGTSDHPPQPPSPHPPRVSPPETRTRRAETPRSQSPTPSPPDPAYQRAIALLV